MSTTEERTAVVYGLRQLADFIESRTDLPLPTCRASLYLWGDDARPQLAGIARVLGTAAKKADEFYYGLTKDFGPVVLSVKASRENVCERVVVGTKTTEYLVPPPGVEMEKRIDTEEIVEWICPPSILALADDAVA